MPEENVNQIIQMYQPVQQVQQNTQEQNIQQVQKEEKKENIQEFHIKLNIRKWILRTPLFRRAKKAAKVIREIIKKRYKGNIVKLSIRLNNYIWSRGIKKPPTKYKLRIIKREDKIYVDLDE
jgi:large subunit ribosomal protein L31e